MFEDAYGEKKEVASALLPTENGFSVLHTLKDAVNSCCGNSSTRRNEQGRKPQ